MGADSGRTVNSGRVGGPPYGSPSPTGDARPPDSSEHALERLFAPALTHRFRPTFHGILPRSRNAAERPPCRS